MTKPTLTPEEEEFVRQARKLAEERAALPPDKRVPMANPDKFSDPIGMDDDGKLFPVDDTKPTPKKDASALEDPGVDVLMEALAKVTAKLQGLEGAELRKHVADVKTQVQSLVTKTELQMADEATRKVAAIEVERLIDTMTKVGTAAGAAAAKYRQPIAQAFRGVDVAKMAEGLRLLAAWLQDPSDQAALKVQDMIAKLQETMGPMVGWDPERVDRERRETIKKDVQSSLDAIFRPHKSD